MDREKKQEYAMKDLQSPKLQETQFYLYEMKERLVSEQRRSADIQQAIEDGKVSSEALEAEQNRREELKKGIQNLE